MSDAPIRVYTPWGSEGDGALLAACPALAKLRGLELQWVTAEDRTAILASPYLARSLVELTVHTRLESPAAVDELAHDIRQLTGLRRLVLWGTLHETAVPSLIALVMSRGVVQDRKSVV